MKRFFALMLAGLLLCSFALPVLAASDTARMMQGDDYQDALLVGKITETVEGYVMFDVVRTVNGKPAESPFLLFEGELFSIPMLTEFAVGDGILASVRYLHDNRSSGSMAYRAYKVELKQDKKIKMDVSEWDVGFIEWYVNTGERFMTGNGNSVSRYDEGSTDKQLIFDGQNWLMDSLDSKYTAPEVKREPIKPLLANFTTKQVLLLFGGCAVIGLIAITLLVVVVIKKKHKKSTL